MRYFTLLIIGYEMVTLFHQCQLELNCTYLCFAVVNLLGQLLQNLLFDLNTQL